MDKISLIIKSRRQELNLTFKNIADAVGVAVSTVLRWESGDIENMKRDKIVKLAKVLQISPAVIMGWEDMPVVRLSKKEESIIIKYREQPQMQEAVDKILGIKS